MFLRKILNFIPRNEFSKGLDHFNRGEYRKAIERFESLLRDKDSRPDLDVQNIELYACEAHVGLSKSYMEKGNLAKAVEEMERAVQLKPHFADLRYNLAELYTKRGSIDDAIENFKKALEINPKFFKARVCLAKVLYAQSRTAEALAELERAGEYCPNFSKEKFSELVQAVRVTREDEETNGLFKEILEERPSSSQLSRELAMEAIQNGNYAEAIRELKKAIAVNPDYPDLHNFLGIAYGNSGMVDDSIAEFETALKINPYYSRARLNLAIALYEKGRFEEAQMHLGKVLEVQPTNQLALNLLTELNAVRDR